MDDSTTTRNEPAPVTDALISFDYFSKVKLRIGQIINAEPIAKSEKLLKLQVDLGEQLGKRQVVAGIGKRYQPDELIGRKIVVVANLETAKLMGQESQGMLLAASDALGSLELLAPDPSIPVGAEVR
jgi:methionyl-tRNA synthetase